MMHFVFYFRGLMVPHSVYLKGPALSPWQWLIPGEPKGHSAPKLAVQLFPQGNHLTNQQSPLAATDASPPSINKNRIAKTQGTCGGTPHHQQ